MRAGEREGDPEAPQASLDALAQLLERLVHGNGPTAEEIERMARKAGLQGDLSKWQLSRVERNTLGQMGVHVLADLLDAVAELLAQTGMSREAIARVMAGMEANRQALTERVAQAVAALAAQERADSQPHHRQDVSDLMRRPLSSLEERGVALLRRRRGSLHVKRLMRANLRYGGVPLELRFKVRYLKPKLLLICDVSTSMRPVVAFFLRMIYELQDQVASARSFAFIDDLDDITPDLSEHRPEVAIDIVPTRLPPGHYRTNLGSSLNTLMEPYPGTVKPRTTVIFVGDARNN